MRFIGIDPGSVQTAIALIERNGDGSIRLSGSITENERVLSWLDENVSNDRVAIEMIASYGMPVGAEVFETCVWIGRFVQMLVRRGPEPVRIKRIQVKMHLCNSARAKDANVRQALLDRWGAPGTKKAPGLTYGFKADMWAALAVATKHYDDLTQGVEHARLREMQRRTG